MPGTVHTNQSKCPHCHHQYASMLAAMTCCLFAPKVATGWCAWCGRDCKETFCSRPCAVAYRNDVLASREVPPARGWCAWCGRDCRGTFCNKACELAYGKDEQERRPNKRGDRAA